MLLHSKDFAERNLENEGIVRPKTQQHYFRNTFFLGAATVAVLYGAYKIVQYTSKIEN